jgi:Uma2 family endonuclease
MATLTIKLPPHVTQWESNQRRWAELLADRQLAQIEGRIETDRHGRMVLSLPPAPRHGSFQAEIGHLLWDLLPDGRVVTVCPISTADGVKAADVAWASPGCMKELGDNACFPRAPEICAEVLSPSNTNAEIQEKAALYFDAGAREVWLCSETGAMSFLGLVGGETMALSKLCPDFPRLIQLR